MKIIFTTSIMFLSIVFCQFDGIINKPTSWLFDLVNCQYKDLRNKLYNRKWKQAGRKRELGVPEQSFSRRKIDYRDTRNKFVAQKLYA